MRIPTFIAMSSDVEDAFTFSTREAAKSHAVDIRDRNRNHASGEAPKLMRVKKHDGCFILTDGVDFWTVNYPTTSGAKTMNAREKRELCDLIASWEWVDGGSVSEAIGRNQCIESLATLFKITSDDLFLAGLVHVRGTVSRRGSKRRKV